MTNRVILTALVIVFSFNIIENVIEAQWPPREPALANAAEISRSERSSEIFRGQSQMGAFLVLVSCLAYFVGLPLMVVGTLLWIPRSGKADALRVFALAMVIDYAISLCFFLLFPVPERWYFAGSGATLLSNRNWYGWIAFMRPFSGLTHCFPSFHTSSSMLVVLTAFWRDARWKWTLLIVGCFVLLSTLTLGIHWFVDIVGGIATGLAAFAIALRFAGFPYSTSKSVTAGNL